MSEKETEIERIRNLNKEHLIKEIDELEAKLNELEDKENETKNINFTIINYVFR